MNILLTLLPLLITAIPGIVQAVEAAATPGTSGAEKKAAVLAAVEQMAAVAAGIDPADAALIKLCAQFAGPVIDCIVAAYNLRNIFTHKSAAATAGK